jgi:hypothetical protein
MRKTIIVALARKLLIALWRHTTAGVVIEGAVMKAAPATIRPHPPGPDQSCRIPGGRTEMTVGLNSRPKEWSRPPEAPPAGRGMLVQPPSGHENGAQTLDPNQRPEN